MADNGRQVPSTDEYPRGATRVWSDIDIDKEGKSVGEFRVNISPAGRGSSYIPIPVAVYKNGEGPRILLLGGVHGDEYEGQVMLLKLMHTLEIENVKGHLIILPVANPPAAEVGERCSPIDGGNLNRAYPGNPNGTPTEEIAFFIETVLLPKVDILLDFHSGARTFYITPSAHIYYSEDKALFERGLAMLRAFGMPTSVILKGLMGYDKKAIGACERNGVLRFSTELGGGGGITLDALRRAEVGLARLLFHLGALRKPITEVPPPPVDLVMRLPNRSYVYAREAGLFEPYVDIGDRVVAGQAAGAIHFPEAPWRAPLVPTFGQDSFVHGLCVAGRVQRGDALAMLHVPWVAP